jgi:uncharacterized protein YlaI
MIFYESICICCKKNFKILEGTLKYQKYKTNMQGRFTCENCDHKIYMEARKYMMGKIT